MPQRCRERMHRHAKPLNQVGTPWSGLNPEFKAESPSRLSSSWEGPALFYRAIPEVKSFPFPAQPREGSVPAFGTCPPEYPWGAWPRGGKASATPRLTPLLMESPASASQAFLQQRRIGLRQGRAASAQEKTSVTLLC